MTRSADGFVSGSDILERLRDPAGPIGSILADAAAEIERLRAAVPAAFAEGWNRGAVLDEGDPGDMDHWLALYLAGLVESSGLRVLGVTKTEQARSSSGQPAGNRGKADASGDK